MSRHKHISDDENNDDDDEILLNQAVKKAFRPPTPDLRTFMITFEDPNVRQDEMVVAHGCHIADAGVLIFWNIEWDQKMGGLVQRTIRGFRTYRDFVEVPEGPGTKLPN